MIIVAYILQPRRNFGISSQMLTVSASQSGALTYAEVAKSSGSPCQMTASMSPTFFSPCNSIKHAFERIKRRRNAP